MKDPAPYLFAKNGVASTGPGPPSTRMTPQIAQNFFLKSGASGDGYATGRLPEDPRGQKLLYGLRNGSGGHSAKQEPKNERLARAEELLPSTGKFTVRLSSGLRAINPIFVITPGKSGAWSWTTIRRPSSIAAK
jgi:hypothetical protein